MGICYDDNPKGGFSGDVWKMDAVAAYVRHYENSLYLSFILEHSDDPREKAQASRELGICDKKLDFWKRHPLYVEEDALRRVDEAKKRWAGKR